MNYLRLNVIYDATVGLQFRALWSKVLACFANCWQKIAISPQKMLTNIWYSYLSTFENTKSGNFLPPPIQ